MTSLCYFFGIVLRLWLPLRRVFFVGLHRDFLSTEHGNNLVKGSGDIQHNEGRNGKQAVIYDSRWGAICNTIVL